LVLGAVQAQQNQGFCKGFPRAFGCYSDLNRVGCPAASSRGIGTGAVAGDHLNAGVFAQPGRKRFGFAVRKQRHQAVAVEVHQHRAVGVPLAQRSVVHAQRCRRGV